MMQPCLLYLAMESLWSHEPARPRPRARRRRPRAAAQLPPGRALRKAVVPRTPSQVMHRLVQSTQAQHVDAGCPGCPGGGMRGTRGGAGRAPARIDASSTASSFEAVSACARHVSAADGRIAAAENSCSDPISTQCRIGGWEMEEDPSLGEGDDGTRRRRRRRRWVRRQRATVGGGGAAAWMLLRPPPPSRPPSSRADLGTPGLPVIEPSVKSAALGPGGVTVSDSIALIHPARCVCCPRPGGEHGRSVGT